MSRVNLLYVITKLELGGAQKQLLSLISHLNKERFNLFLFTAQDGLLLPEALSINGLTLKKSKCLVRAINPFRDFLALIEIYRFIQKNNIEVVHTHSSKAGILGRFAARLAKVKVILHTVHGWSFNDYQPRLVRRLFVWLERICAGFTHKIIIVSHHDQQKGLDNRIGERSKYIIIRYGIDYSKFDKKDDNLRKELGISPNTLVVGMITCFKPQKSPQDFIKLASLFKNTSGNLRFVLVGDGILRNKLERLISKFGLKNQIILTGWRRDIPRVLSTIDVFVLTSLWEGLPIAVLEAMVSAKPVIATDTGGIQEVVIEGKTGFLCRPRNVEKIAERLALLLNDEPLRRNIGKNARQSLGFNFSLGNMINNTENLYLSLMRKEGILYAN